MFDGSFAADVIADFGQCYRVTRRKAGTHQHGVYVPTQGAHAAETIDIVASVQPASGRELLRLPEERRTEETRRLLTATVLQVGGQGSGYEADLVTIDGVAWEVQNVKRWPDYTDALVQRPAVPNP